MADESRRSLPAVAQEPRASTPPPPKSLALDLIVPEPEVARVRTAHAPEMSTKVLNPLVSYMRTTYGDAAVASLAKAAETDVRGLESSALWLSHGQFEAILKTARAQMANDEEFLAACSHGLKSYGPILLVLRATSPLRIFEILVRTMHFVSRMSKYELLEGSRTSARLRYVSTRPESRLMCLSRQAFLRALPPLWGLPKAQLVEDGCISRGDPHCTYALRWYESTRLAPVAFGALVGIGLAWLTTHVAALQGLEYLTLPTLGAAVGLVLETRRAARRNLEYGDESHRALEALGDEYANALSEVLELHRRELEWNELLEDRITDRQNMLDRVMQQVNQMREQRQTTLRSLSHDLRSPLQVVRLSGIAVRDIVGAHAEIQDILQDVDFALDKMERLFKELMTFANADAPLFEMRPEPMTLAPLADRVRGTLKALVIQRDIRIGVFPTREAPEAIETDLLLFNRVLDNCLTNAGEVHGARQHRRRDRRAPRRALHQGVRHGSRHRVRAARPRVRRRPIRRQPAPGRQLRARASHRCPAPRSAGRSPRGDVASRRRHHVLAVLPA